MRIAHGREAEVYARDADTVVKLYLPGYRGHTAEALALTALNRTGVAPRLFGTVQVDGRDGLILQRLEGVDMLALLERQPWRLAGLARSLARAALRIHSVPAPAELPGLKTVLAERIAAASLAPHLHDFVLEVLQALPDGSRLCHGDFHPANAIVGHGQVGVIDWSASARGAPEADFARTVLLLKQAAALPGTPLVFRTLMAAGRSLFAAMFARAYRTGTAEPMRHFGQWTAVQAAARLAEGLPGETVRLTAIVQRAYRHG